ncbi:MAG: hypothetical protein SP4CHLAM5_08970 [Chlamydiia bacterium]|nr:hypothetical protein [Chlamydiia bacterium]MCH9618760.1 hypothetical protein [Chlamydiia bacterium]MCH9624439.1 hypothetical protein [Chlamydiia bacterium]
MLDNKKTYISFDGEWLGEVKFTPQFFKKSIYNQLQDKSLQKMTSFEKHRFVGNILLEEIKASAAEAFIFPAIVDFITKVRDTILPTYTFNSFEIFLDNYSNLSAKEVIFLRGKVVGRFIPRSEYQAFFPIGMGGTFKGSHFSVAHFSPDVDTVIASFHGFLDAFAAKVGTGVHYWQVPSGPPAESVEIENLFLKALGKNVFDVCVKTSRNLFITSLDLVSQDNLVVKKLSDRSIGIEHQRMQNSVIVTTEKGEYYADWRAVDFDEVRMVINHFVMALQSFEKSLYLTAIEFLLKKVNFQEKASEIMERKISTFFSKDSQNQQSMQRQDLFLKQVLGSSAGISSSIKNFLSTTEIFKDLYKSLQSIEKGAQVEKGLQLLHKAFEGYFTHLDTLEIAVAVKRKVLKISPVTVSHLDDYDTVIEKMGTFSHLTVVHEEKNALTPLGVIHAKDLKKDSLATVSIRDFSNSDEMNKASYIDIISCIDHHKSELTTKSPSRMIVSDAQSSNSIIARMNMTINEKYCTGGYNAKEISEQLKELKGELDTPSGMRIMKRLLSKKEALMKKTMYFVSKDKVFLDYYHFLFAILDDTDLLTKVTAYDVYVVRDLLNKMKSLMLCREVEIVHFDNLNAESNEFAQNAAKKLLQTHDLYSLYHSSYSKRELKIDEMLKKATSTMEEPFFQDTKVLSKHAQIGQCKLFSSNHATFAKKKADIQKHWLKRCSNAADKNSDLTIFAFMVSTIDSAEDLFSGVAGGKSNIKDEIWITCILGDRNAFEQAKKFLFNLLKSPKVFPQNVELHLHGTLAELKDATSKVSGRVNVNASKGKIPIAELLVDLKSLKSRKSDIAPYL